MAEVAVAILNYNGEEHLKTFLPSIISHSKEASIIIGDNGSTDGSLELLKTMFPQVEVIQLDSNHGYAGGYNRLIHRIQAEYIVLANSDIEVTEDWLEPLVQVLDKNQDVAAVQPKILSYTNKHLFEYAGAGGGFMDRFGYPYCRGRIFASIEEDNGQYNDEINTFWASGACFITKKSIFEELGGFDESFFAHMEEIDLNWRMLKAGYKIKYTGLSKVYHLGGGTLAYNNAQKIYLNFRNGWAMLIKNLSEHNRFTTFLTRYLLDLFSIIFFLVQFQAANAFAVLRAHFYILINHRKIKKSALKFSTSTKNSSKTGLPNFSLVWQYYIRRKRNFKDLIPD